MAVWWLYASQIVKSLKQIIGPCSSFSTAFFIPKYFFSIPFKISPPIAPAADTKSGFAIAPKIGKKSPFCLFLPTKCHTPRLM